MTFQQFMSAVEALLSGTAEGKGYNGSGPDGENELYRFVRDMTGGDHHACGEIIYKVKRFEAKGNIEDILKAAAWAFLVCKHYQPKAELRHDPS